MQRCPYIRARLGIVVAARRPLLRVACPFFGCRLTSHGYIELYEFINIILQSPSTRPLRSDPRFASCSGFMKAFPLTSMILVYCRSWNPRLLSAALQLEIDKRCAKIVLMTGKQYLLSIMIVKGSLQTLNDLTAASGLEMLGSHAQRHDTSVCLEAFYSLPYNRTPSLLHFLHSLNIIFSLSPSLPHTHQPLFYTTSLLSTRISPVQYG